MRILQISSAKTFGGGERHLVDLVRGLERRSHKCFVTLRPTNEWESRLAFLPPERFLHVSIHNSFGMFSARRIADFVRRNQIDIIHAHVARDYLAASIAARSQRDVRLVLTRHVMFPMKAFQRYALRNVDAAIAVSRPVRDELLRTFPADKIHTIPNGVDTAVFTADERERLGREFRAFHSIPADVPVVSGIGELKPLKGQRDLVLAANEVLRKTPDVRFVIAGVDNSIDKGFRRELRRLVRVLGIERNFLWLDWIEDTRPLLAATDLFVSPSHSESFGLAILNAMVVGCAVVATATGGAIELVADESELVPIKDPLNLAERIEWFLGHETERRALGRKLEAKAAAAYSIEKMVDATEELYRRLLS